MIIDPDLQRHLEHDPLYRDAQRVVGTIVRQSSRVVQLTPLWRELRSSVTIRVAYLELVGMRYGVAYRVDGVFCALQMVGYQAAYHRRLGGCYDVDLSGEVRFRMDGRPLDPE